MHPALCAGMVNAVAGGGSGRGGLQRAAPPRTMLQRVRWYWDHPEEDAPPPPPPALWRTQSGAKWSANATANAAAAWRDARWEATDSLNYYKDVHKWVALLRGENSSARYWADGVVPQALRYPRTAMHERISCPLQQGLHRSGKAPKAGGGPQHQCNEWWPPPAASACTAFIVGVGDDWKMSRAAARRGCHVHAYDPTTRLRKRHAREVRQFWREAPPLNVSFHFSGLSGGERSGSLNSFGAVDGTVLASLSALADANPEGERAPSVMQIDCEGCEWAAMAQIGRDPRSLELLRGVRLLFFEAHLTPVRLPPTLRQFVGAFRILFEKLGFRLRWLRSIDGYPSDQSVADFLGVAGLHAGLCCYEMALVRG